MDSRAKLQALMGGPSTSSKSSHRKSNMENTDFSDLQEEVHDIHQDVVARGAAASRASETMNEPRMVDLTEAQEEPPLGMPAEDGCTFTPLMLVKKYPYQYIGVANSQRVAEAFFDEKKLMNNNIWSLYYIHRSSSAFENNPIILVPTSQFKAFLDIINQQLDTQLAIPSGNSNTVFNLTFNNNGAPIPRYLGRSNSDEAAELLRKNVPPNSFRVPGEMSYPAEDRSLEAFKEKIALIVAVQKGKKSANKERSKAERIAKQQEFGAAIKRVQRYLGLREAKQNIDNSISSLLPPMFDGNKLAPFLMESDCIFISVDVEAYERDSNKITELGFATLDTRDLLKVCPGPLGENWFPLIRSRHFRITEYRHLVNKDFVTGCADRFEFGESEFISIKEGPSETAKCFKEPFSKPGEPIPAVVTLPKRNIILVGHDIKADIEYLRKMGYDVYNLSNLLELVDTASLWRFCTREMNPRNLGSILAELNIMGWNLHNAGNDATYTLQAMVAISIKHLVDKQAAQEVVENQKAQRIAESVEEARANAIEREEGWSTDGEDDGGVPTRPSPPKVNAAPYQILPARPFPRRQQWSQKPEESKQASRTKLADSNWRRQYAADGPSDPWGAQNSGSSGFHPPPW